MLYYCIISFAIILVSFFMGIVVKNIFGFKTLKNIFAIPIGFLIYTGILQVFFMPMTYFDIDSKYFILLFFIISVIPFIICLIKYKWLFSYMKNLNNRRVYILLSLVIFVISIFIFKNIEINFRLDDINFYGVYIPGRIDNNSLGGISYDYQGYFLLISILMKIGQYLSEFGIYTNFLDLGFVLWVPALITFWMFSFTISDFLSYAYKKMNSKKIGYFLAVIVIIIVFSDYWYFSFPHFGGTIRRLPMIFLLLFSEEFFKNNKRGMSYLMFLLISAFMSFSSSAFFISMMFLATYFIYSIVKKRSNYIIELAIMGITPVIYAGIYKPVFGKLFLILYILVAILCVLKLDKLLETKINKIPLSVFLIIPLVMIYFTFFSGKFPILDFPNMVGREFFTPINHYDMVPDLINMNFVDHPILAIFNLVYWIGISYYLFLGIRQKKWFSWLILIILVFFFNPFVFKFVSYYMTSVVYFRITDIFFNIVVLFDVCVLIYEKVQKKKIIITIFVIIAILKVSMFSVPIFAQEGNYNYIYHANNDELDLIEKLEKEYLKENYKTDEKINVASHIYGIQLLSNYDLINILQDRFAYSTIDTDEFERVFYRRQPGFDDREVDYTRACSLAFDKNLQFVILDAQYNWKLQEGLWPCSEVLFEEDNYRVLKMNYDYWEWNINQGYTKKFQITHDN